NGAIWSVAFVQVTQKSLLVSAAWGWDADQPRSQYEVRLWDIISQKAVADAPVGKLPFGKDGHAIGLTAWSTGASANDVRVALATNEKSRLLIWDAAAGEVTAMVDGPGNLAATYVPSRKALVTSSLVKSSESWHACFREWDVTGKAPRDQTGWTHGAGTSFYWPLALSPVTIEAGKGVYVAAVCRVDW